MPDSRGRFARFRPREGSDGQEDDEDDDQQDQGEGRGRGAEGRARPGGGPEGRAQACGDAGVDPGPRAPDLDRQGQAGPRHAGRGLAAGRTRTGRPQDVTGDRRYRGLKRGETMIRRLLPVLTLVLIAWRGSALAGQPDDLTSVVTQAKKDFIAAVKSAETAFNAGTTTQVKGLAKGTISRPLAAA